MLEVTYYRAGGVSSQSEIDMEGKILAKQTFSKTTGQNAYYILCSGGTMYNPNDTGTYTRSMIWKMARVNDSAFKLYISFLKSKRVATLRQAERMI